MGLDLDRLRLPLGDMDDELSVADLTNGPPLLAQLDHNLLNNIMIALCCLSHLSPTSVICSYHSMDVLLIQHRLNELIQLVLDQYGPVLLCETMFLICLTQRFQPG